LVGENAVDLVNASDELGLTTIAWMPHLLHRDIEPSERHAGVSADRNDASRFDHGDQCGQQRPGSVALGSGMAAI